MGHGTHRRDLPNEELNLLLARREPLLLDLADIVIDATRAPIDIVDELVSALARAEEGRL